jgi:hypothetical protein
MLPCHLLSCPHQLRPQGKNNRPCRGLEVQRRTAAGVSRCHNGLLLTHGRRQNARCASVAASAEGDTQGTQVIANAPFQVQATAIVCTAVTLGMVILVGCIGLKGPQEAVEIYMHHAICRSRFWVDKTLRLRSRQLSIP